MDKRTLMAFALVFAFLALWNLLFKPDLPPARNLPPAGAPADTTALFREPRALEQASPPALLGTSGASATESAAGEIATPGSVATGWPTTAADELVVPIQVITDRFTAEIDPVGGDILSWKLRDYLSKDGHPVELVSARALQRGAPRAHALRVAIDAGTGAGAGSVELRDVRFVPSATRLELSEAYPEAALELTAQRGDGAAVRLQYQFHHDAYAFEVQAHVQAPELLDHRVIWEVAWPGGIASTEQDTNSEYSSYKAAARVGADVHRKPLGALGKGDGNGGRAAFEGTLSWAGVLSKYFTALQLTPAGNTGSVYFDGDYGRRLQTFMTRSPMQSSGSSASFAYTVYMGPLDYDRLAAYGADAGKLIDLGPNMFRPFARGTLWIMKAMYGVIPNYGWVIVILSVVLKVVFYPLTKSSTQSMRRMQEIQPKLQKLRERYKDDQQRQSKEMLELYKQHKINPMGGCLPLLVQMPVFWALFTVLRASIELRQAPWVAWITDLSVPDVLFRLPFSLPMFGDKFCLLPTLMALAMWAQTKLGATPTPTGEGAMAMQMRMMNNLMPIMMFVFFYNSPAGLSLYWLINTVLTALQTWKIHREMAPLGEAAAQAKPA